jgi:hypothetical protein
MTNPLIPLVFSILENASFADSLLWIVVMLLCVLRRVMPRGSGSEWPSRLSIVKDLSLFLGSLGSLKKLAKGITGISK